MQLEYEGERGDKLILRVPITKASTKEEPSFVEVCWDDLPNDVCKEIMLQGMKTLLNRGMSKITDAKKDAGAREAAMEQAKTNLTNLYEGKIRMSAGVRTKITGAVKTEAMRLARIIIKDQLKSLGKKVSLIKAKDISEAATKFLESERGEEVWTRAKANLEARAKEEASTKDALQDILVGITEDKELTAKAAKNKRPKKGEQAPAGVVAGKGQTQHQGVRH